MNTPIGENLFADPSLDLDPAEVRRRQAAGELDIVDIREQYEWDAGRAPGYVRAAVPGSAVAPPGERAGKGQWRSRARRPSW